jgi:hypothetical protein
MSLVRKMKRALRGEVDARTVAREALRRSRVALQQRRERAMLDELDARPARLRAEFTRLSATELLAHFRARAAPKFLPGFNADTLDATAGLQRELFPFETEKLLERAARIAGEHRWSVLGYGEKSFGEIDWRRDPLSGEVWPLDYHCDIRLARGDGSDARVLWEVNRLAHLITLGRAYAVTKDRKFADEVFAQLEGWRSQNPRARGANWSCAMEVALRAMNLLAVFELLRRSPELDEARLMMFLQMFDHHGAHVRRHLEFTYVSTSNHYLSDVVGLLWLGVMLPELSAAAEWRAFGLRELLAEMDKQVLADGADFEASTGYHRLALELFLYSFLLCRANGIEIEDRYWQKLRAMLGYVRAYLRPDGRAPLIGDTDSGQVLPVIQHSGDDHAYVLALGAAVFKEPRFKLDDAQPPEELLWLLGEEGLRDYERLRRTDKPASSQAFADAGTYVMREGDLYMLFNASGCGLDGRGSHGHNDALSLEVSACGRPFIVDPGTFVYTSDLRERHLFRSTAYHSTVEIDETEQNSTDASTPFVIGNEAKPRVIRWESTSERDQLIAEHSGYARLNPPVIHRRGVEFDKRRRLWLVEDSFSLKGGGHIYRFRFHFADGLEISVRPANILQAWDKMSGARLYIAALELSNPPVLEERFTSRDYGAKLPSISACWTTRIKMSFSLTWMLVPVCPDDDERARLSLITEARQKREQEAQLDSEALKAQLRSSV